MLDKESFKKISVFILFNILFFGIHYSSLVALELQEQTLINLPVSYFINASFSLLVCVGVYYSNQVFKGQAGFIYLALSVVKMILLYAILYPQNDLVTISKADKFILLIPFGLNLVLEQVYVVKLLKLMDLSDS